MRGRGVLGRIHAYFHRPTRHVEKRTEWLVKQHGRHPHVSAFTELIRLSRMPEEAAQLPLQKGENEINVDVTPHERVSRKTLFELEKTVLEKGVEEAAIGVSMHYPALAEILLQKEEYIQFIQTTFSHEKWKKNLLQFSETNPNVRAVGLLLYLRKAYRPPVRKEKNVSKKTMLPDAVA